MVVNRKRLYFGFGIITTLFLLVEAFFCVIQPVTNSGLLIQNSKDGYYVKKINPDSPAGLSGLEEGMIITSVNGTDISSWREYLDIYNFSTYSRKLGKEFAIGKYVTLGDCDGKFYTFKNNRQNFFSCLSSVQNVFFLRLFTALFCVFAAIFCLNHHPNEKNVTSLIRCLIFAGVAIAQCFVSIWYDYRLLIVMSVAFDIGSLVSGSALINYISGELKEIKHHKVFAEAVHYCSFIPAIILFSKYLLVFVFQWDIVTNPLTYFSRIAVFVCSFSIIVFHFYLIMTVPGQISVLFRFVMLSVFCAFGPILLYFARFYLQPEYFMTEIDGFLTIIPFAYFPLLVIFSIIQSKGAGHTKRIKWFCTISSFVVVTVVLIVLPVVITGTKPGYSRIFVLCFISPLVFKFISGVFDVMFSSSGFLIDRGKVSFQDKLQAAIETDDLYRITAREFKRKFNCSFVFFQLYKDEENWIIPYLDRDDLTDNFVNQLIENSARGNYNEPIFQLPYNCYCIPFYKGGMIFCRIFIGYKVNHDVYMSEEKVSMVQLGKYFFQTLIFHENIIQTQIIQSQNKKMMALQTEAINELTNLIENHESEDTFYTKRIYKYVELLAKKARSEGYNADVLTNEYINLLSQAAVIHDIGKIVIPNDILKKPSKLTDEEFEIVKTHTTEGVKIVQDALKNRGNDEIVKLVSSIAGSHHEMWNGKGYPDRLMGEEIPLAARIVAIADVFDALTMPRCYKEPVSIDKAFKIIEESSGIHFDPVLAGFFKELKEPIEQYLDGLDN